MNIKRKNFFKNCFTNITCLFAIFLRNYYKKSVLHLYLDAEVSFSCDATVFRLYFLFQFPRRINRVQVRSKAKQKDLMTTSITATA